MKKTVLSLAFLFFLVTLHANTYYSTNGAAPDATTSWHTNGNGTGSSPANFTSGDIFIIQSGHYLTTTNTWTISGTGAKLIIETGATLQADNKVSVPDFEIDGTGTYIHNNATSNFPGSSTRTFAVASTVETRNWSGTTTLPNPTTWGKLIINVSSYTSNWNQAGNLTDVAGNLIIRNTGSNEFRLATSQDYTLTIGGDLVIESGTLEAGKNNGNYNQKIIINGSFNQSGGTFTRSNNNSNTLKVQFNGTNNNFTKTSGMLTNTYMDWKVNASKKLTLNNDFPVASSRSLTADGTLDCGTNKVTGAGSFTLSSIGDIITSSSSGIDGSISVTGTKTYNNGGSYEFYSATTIPFPATVTSISASNVILHDNVTFNKDVTISGTLDLANGKLTIPAGNTLTLSSGSTIAGSGFDNTKHIVTQVNTSTGSKGILRVSNLIGALTLPIGNGTYYMPIILNAVAANDFSVCVFQGITANGMPNGTALTAAQKASVVDGVWIVNRNSGTNVVSMQLSWPAALEGSSFQTLPDNQIGISHYGSYWESSLGSGSQSLNTATRTGIASFSPFGVSPVSTILPLKFGDFKISEINTDLLVDWSTYNEINVNHFEIERAQTGQQFVIVGRVNAKGNRGNRTDYGWTDTSPIRGISFYRIKEVDIDGRSTYSTVIKIDLSETSSELSLFPNPVINRKISIQVGNISRGQYKISVSNLNGKTIYYQTLDHQGGVIGQVIQLPPDTAPGIYSLSISGNGIRHFKQFVVK
jgi:hypothetical protein